MLRPSDQRVTLIHRQPLLSISLAVVATMVLGGMFVRSYAQDGPPPFVFLSTDELTAVVGTEAAASTIVSQALASRFRYPFSKKATTVVASQIPEAWLPAISGVRFQRLTNEAAREHLQHCGWVLYVHAFTLPDADTVNITVAERNRCGASGIDLRFKHSGDGWQQDPTGDPSGVGGGFESVTGHCACQ
jgi:hypothetical protein